MKVGWRLIAKTVLIRRRMGELKTGMGWAPLLVILIDAARAIGVQGWGGRRRAARRSARLARS